MTLGEAGIVGALVTVCLEDRFQRRQQGENVAVESCVASEAVMPCLPEKLVQASAGLDVAVSQRWVEHVSSSMPWGAIRMVISGLRQRRE